MIEELNKWIDTIANLPPAPFTVLAVIVFGYMLRGLKWVSNDWIPKANVIVGTATYMLLSFCYVQPESGDVADWATRSFFTGIGLGFGAWAIHKEILAKYEDKIPGLKQLVSFLDKAGEDSSVTPKPV